MLSNLRKSAKIITRTNYNNKLRELVPPILFDVSLRDGLQGLSRERQEIFTLEEKQNIFHNIMFNYRPKNIEIGSIINPKVLPIMSDSLELYDYAIDIIKKLSVKNNNTEKDKNEKDKNKNEKNTNVYIVAPNEKGFIIGLNHGITNFSFLTSVSDSFQKKNVNKTLKETKFELINICKKMESMRNTMFNAKLYISCINECPLEGKIDNDFIVHEIMHYSKDFPIINEFCLSDTCGTLNYEDYKYIVDNCIYFGLHPTKISLHLHVRKSSIEEIKKIVYHSLDNNIIRFDVSIMETGGCSITLSSDNLLPNMSYELINNFFEKY